MNKFKVGDRVYYHWGAELLECTIIGESMNHYVLNEKNGVSQILKDRIFKTKAQAESYFNKNKR